MDSDRPITRAEQIERDLEEKRRRRRTPVELQVLGCRATLREVLRFLSKPSVQLHDSDAKALALKADMMIQNLEQVGIGELRKIAADMERDLRTPDRERAGYRY